MSQGMKQGDPKLDEIIAEVRREDVDEQAVEQAAHRVWARVREHWTSPTMATGPKVEKIRGCADFQALVPAYLDRNLSAARTMLLEDHLHGCVACRHVLEEARLGARPFAPRGMEARAPLGRAGGTRPRWVVAWAFAAVVIIIGLLVESVIFRFIESRTVRRWGMQR